MAWGDLFASGLRAMRQLWLGKEVECRKRAGRRRFKRLLVESLEGRDLLAADFLYSLEARPGVPTEGFGVSLAANDQFHVVANFAAHETYYFLEEAPDYDSFFYGEIQVHDATTGELLRTIQNPLPFGNGQFGGWGEFTNQYEFNFRLTTPNSFGYSIDIYENLILVGSPGWDSKFSLVHDDYDFETGGRAFLFDANTGDLLHTFDGSFEPVGTQGRNNDGFGQSVSIDGNRIAIGAPGPNYEDEESQIWDTDPGHVYIYSATTGNELHLLDLPNPNQVETLDFGATVSLDDGKLVVTQGDGFANPVGPTGVYEVATGNLLNTLTVNGFRAILEGNNIAIHAPPNTKLASASTGAITQTIPAPLLDFDGNLLATGTFGFGSTPFEMEIRDFPSGDELYSVPTPPDFAEAYWEYNQIPQVFVDRLLIPGRQGAAFENVVFVYSVTDGPENSPPTDISLTNNAVPENSANETVIGTLSAIDPDSPETFTFALANSAGGRFKVVGNQLRVNNGSLLDFEANTSHNITVEVFDSAGDSYSEAFTIQITNANDSPTNITLSPNTVPEGSANGTIVGTLSATDIDPNETFSFELLSTAGGRFALNDDQIVVADGSVLNFESVPLHSVTVQVTDSAGNAFSKALAISVINSNDPITDLFLLDHKVVEHAPNGTIVAAIDNPAPRPDDYFGTMAADQLHLLVSSHYAPEAYIFDAENFELLHTLPYPNPDVDFVGAAVAISATHAVVGNSLDDTAGPGAGAVHIYNVNTGALQQTLYNPLNMTGFFGESVAIFGNRLVVGSSLGNGRAFVYELSTGNLLLTLTSPQASDAGFGTAVAMTANQIIVGQSSIGAGTVHVYDAATGAFLHTLDNPSPETFDGFGSEIRAVGNRILIGASSDNTAGVDAGAAYLFDATTGALLHTFLPTGSAAGAAYGFALDLTSQRIAIGSIFGSRTYLYNATTFDLIQELPDVHLGNENFGVHLDFGGDRLFVGDQASRGVIHAGEIQVFDATAGDLLPAFRVVDQDATDTYTYTLLDNAGGRFALDGNQLIVANSAALDYLSATSHEVTVQVTDSGGSSFTKTLTIEVINVNEPPTDIALSNSTLAEPKVRLVHNLQPETGRRLGDTLAVSGNRMLVSDLDLDATPTVGRVVVVDINTGERLTTLVNPAPVPNQFSADGSFGVSAAIAGDLAVVTAVGTTIGGQDFVGTVYVFDMTTGAVVHTLTSPAANKSGFGASVAAWGDIIAIGSSDGLQGGGAGIVYLYRATTGALLATIANPNPGTLFDAFGSELALHGTTLVISAAYEQVGASVVGRAYLYQLNATTFQATLVATLNNPTPAEGDFFGSRVTVAGDLVAISAVDDAGAADAGAVYVFNAATGSLLQTILHPAPSTNDALGYSLAISGQYVIAGSRSQNTGGAGRAYVFHASTGVLVATIENLSPNSLDSFSQALVADGSRIVISAPGDDTDGLNFGMVYVYDLPFGQTVGTLSATDSDAAETFTYSLLDNADGRFAIDGNQLIIADATKLDYEAGSTHNITVQVTDSTFNTFSKVIPIMVTPVNEPPQDITASAGNVQEPELRYFHNPAPAANNGFAYGVAVAEDRLIVGRNALTVSGQAGSAHVFDRNTGELVTTLVSPAPQLGDLFGERVAISGNRAVVGARHHGNPATGEAYVFDVNTGTLLHTLTPDPADPMTPGRQFGSAVAIAGNLIAISSNPIAQALAGAVYLYNATTGALLQKIVHPGPGSPLAFGASLSLSGNRLVIGSSGDSQGATNSGRAFVYQFSPATQTATLATTLNNPSPALNDFFGDQVRVQGNTVAVSAFRDDTLAADSGQVYLFNATTGALLHTIENPTPNASDNFGSSISLFTDNTGARELLLVSSQFDDATGTDSGIVYLFDVATGDRISTLNNPSPNTGDFFGGFVEGTGPEIFVTSTTDDTDGLNFGMVYQFTVWVDLNVKTLSATDPDTGDSFTLEMTDTAEGRFALVDNKIVVADHSKIDFEANLPHFVVVKATDSVGNSVSETIQINVSNIIEAPQDISFTGNSIAENSANGTVVSTLTASDPDVGNTITYSLDDNAGGRFGIVGNTIVVANGSLIDFETAASHLVLVRAIDNFGMLVLEALTIDVTDVLEGFDFGDLPNSFGTTLATNGARHMFSGMRLGATKTSEPDGQPSANANLDVGDDGVTLPPVLIPGLTATFLVEASQPGRLDVFLDSVIDDGQFTEEERLTTANGLVLSAGTNVFALNVPATTGVSGSRAIRFRFSLAGGLAPTGLANEGEVEDYRVNVAALPVNSVQLLPDPDVPGATLMYVTGSQAADTIVVAPFNGQLRATINGVNKSPLAPLSVSRIVIFGRNGNDDIRINNTAIPGYIDGGGNNDTIRGGNGPDRVFGRSGNDTIYGRAGDDEIFGGEGNDTLYGDAGLSYLFGEGGNDSLYGNGVLVGGIGADSLYANGARNFLLGGVGKDMLFGASVNQGDLIVAMATIHDTNLVALKAIHNEWKKAGPVATRIANLNGPTAGGLNGPYFVTASAMISDSQADAIYNNGSNNATLNDWIFKSPNDSKPSPKGIVVTI